MSNTLKKIFKSIERKGCDPQSPEIQCIASLAVRDHILKGCKTQSVSLREGFSLSVRQLAWQSPAQHFDVSRGERARWGHIQKKIMHADCAKSSDVNQIISLARAWAQTPPSTLEPIREVIARNYIYFSKDL